MIHTGGDGGFKRTMDILGVGRVRPGHRRSGDGRAARRRRVPRRPPARAGRPSQPGRAHEWVELFHAADLAALPVLRPTEVLLDDQVAFADVVVELPDQHGPAAAPGRPGRQVRGVAARHARRRRPPSAPTTRGSTSCWPALPPAAAGRPRAGVPQRRRPRPRRPARARLQQLLRRPPTAPSC